MFIWFSEVFLLQVGTPKNADCENRLLLQHVEVYGNRSSRLIDRFARDCKSACRKTFTICIRRNIVEARSLLEIARTGDRFWRCEIAEIGGMIFLDRMTSKTACTTWI